MRIVPVLRSKPILALAILICAGVTCQAQIRPPGYEREVEAMQERQRTSVLDKDSLTLVDTISLFDPSSYEETTKIVTSTLSWRDYLTMRLGINNPDALLNGTPMKIMDPGTYEEITIRWNPSAAKLDTIRQ